MSALPASVSPPVLVSPPCAAHTKSMGTKRASTIPVKRNPLEAINTCEQKAYDTMVKLGVQQSQLVEAAYVDLLAAKAMAG